MKPNSIKFINSDQTLFGLYFVKSSDVEYDKEGKFKYNDKYEDLNINNIIYSPDPDGVYLGNLTSLTEDVLIENKTPLSSLLEVFFDNTSLKKDLDASYIHLVKYPNPPSDYLDDFQ